MGCEDEYIGESDRTFGERFREHMRAPSPIIDHHNITGHEGVSGQLQYSGQGGPQYCQNHQRGNIDQSHGPIPEYKYRQVPAATHLG